MDYSNVQVWVLDLGSQYAHLIVKKVRQSGVSAQLLGLTTFEQLIQKKLCPKALIISGGPSSVNQDTYNYAPIFNLNIPILGICYGMQLMADFYGGLVQKQSSGEYGDCQVELKSKKLAHILEGQSKTKVWMAHFDSVVKIPEGFECAFESESKKIAGIYCEEKKRLGLQFHPEVHHSERGEDILRFFLFQISNLEKDWKASRWSELSDSLVESCLKGHVLCAFSGGVDSLVAATLASRKLGDRLHCVFVDHGMMRDADTEHIKELQKETQLKIHVINAQEHFFKELKGVSDPEDKRKIIGRCFIEVLEKNVLELEKKYQLKFEYLLQGTLYPDVIESKDPKNPQGKSHTIKTHHNVGGLPEKMKLQLLEPLRDFYKDEVRQIGLELGLKHHWLYRHPFPGPGLGVRVLGEVSPQKLICLRAAEKILHQELKNFNLYNSIWQALCVLLPIKTVGVKGDERAYEEVIALRLVNSVDGMTADWAQVPSQFLNCFAKRVVNEVAGITRVVYDITSKPPATIEWE